jgi:hypothetical protein
MDAICKFSGSDQSGRIFSIIKNFIKTLSSAPAAIIPEDAQYKWYFIKYYMPLLYQRHTAENRANCIYCANLVRGRCHKYCFKCSIGTHIKCGSSLPGAIYKMPSYPDEEEYAVVPWFYRKPCDNFKRLPPYLYLKNLYPILGMAGTNNLEILEGLEKGLSSGMRPCHVCASVDYALYKECSKQECFDLTAPCSKITSEIGKYYKKIDSLTPTV